jgi:hypothetical protein
MHIVNTIILIKKSQIDHPTELMPRDNRQQRSAAYCKRYEVFIKMKLIKTSYRPVHTLRMNKTNGESSKQTRGKNKPNMPDGDNGGSSGSGSSHGGIDNDNIPSKYQQEFMPDSAAIPSPYAPSMVVMECKGPEDLARAVMTINRDTVRQVGTLTKEAITLTREYVDANVECMQKQIDHLQGVIVSLFEIINGAVQEQKSGSKAKKQP